MERLDIAAQPPAARSRAAPDRRAGRGVRSPKPSGRVRRAAGQTSSRPRLTVVSGPTAVGKGTVVAAAAPRAPGGLRLGLGDHPTAATRRGRRRALPVRLRARVRRADRRRTTLLEWAVVHGRHRYGTPRAPVLAALAAGPRRRCWRSICRAPARSGPTGRTRASSSWPRRPGRSWSVGWSAGAPRPPSSGTRRLDTAPGRAGRRRRSSTTSS